MTSINTKTLVSLIKSHGANEFMEGIRNAYRNKEKPEKFNDNEWNMIKYGFQAFSEIDDEIWNKDKEEAKLKQNSQANQKVHEEYAKQAKNIASQNASKSKTAKEDVKKYEQLEKDYKTKPNETKNETDYAKKKTDFIDDFTKPGGRKDKILEQYMSETCNGDTKMVKLSNKEVNELFSAMKTLRKHYNQNFDEEVVDDETEEDVIDDTTDDEDDTTVEDNVTLELPADAVEAIKDAVLSDEEDELLKEAEAASADEDVEDDETEEDKNEDEEEVDECGTSEFSEFNLRHFAEVMTFAIENLDKKAEKIANDIINKHKDEFIEEFSMKEFRSFAESVNETLTNIQDRVAAMEIKSGETPDKVTTDLDVLKETGDDYEEDFITKSDDAPEAAEEEIVQNPEASFIPDESTTPEQFSERYNTVKDFLTL